MGLLSREEKAEEKVTLNLKDIEFLLSIIADYRIKGTDISQAVNTIVKLQSFAKELKEYGIKPI
jgi:hypothetical protein